MEEKTLVTKRHRARACILFAAAVLCAAGAVGCGGGGSDEGPKAKHELTRADNAKAKQLLLTLADFSGASGSWTRDLDKSDDDSDNKCADKAISSLTVTGRADGDTFSEGDGSAQASADAVVFKDEQSAAKAYSLVANDKTVQCLAKYLKREVAKSAKGEVKVGDVSTGALPSPGIGERSAGYRLGIEFEASGLNVTYNMDLVMAGAGRAFVFSYFGDVGTFDQDLKQSLLTKLGERLSSPSAT